MSRKISLLLAIALLVPLAGCVPSGDEVKFGFSGSINATPSEFHMDGYVSMSGGIPDRDVYHNVSIRLYNSDGEMIDSKFLGDLDGSSDPFEIAIRDGELPTYVTIESPDFWNEKMVAEYYVKMDSEYGVEYASSRSELPVT
ncbi:hypothetical protein HLRTI_001052 [Halorhabdus tiamatea SARL4B]|uniref:Membrane lipoprotein n=1 Tax=Halorhabdus tiamatea SARL4B TaxID=1033806 RepID=U2E3E6_9EURY|nr:hypothetical protein [Halorhabdus tiamatea]ERJ06798.1 hypothetical protein HLRTI_001052 [Halorhabdus tiamatea SARL4B]